MKKVKTALGIGNSWASRHTHDGLGKPLPKWIQDGSVAYEPIKPKAAKKFQSTEEPP